MYFLNQRFVQNAFGNEINQSKINAIFAFRIFALLTRTRNPSYNVVHPKKIFRPETRPAAIKGL